MTLTPPSTPMRRLWLLGRGALTNARRLGPAVRTLEMARWAKNHGMIPVIALDQVEFDEDGIETAILSKELLDRIAPTDAIVVSPHLPWRILIPLVRSRRTFHVDSHGLGAVEGMESETGLPAWRLFQGRRRTALRMRMLLHRCARIYLSIPEQTAFLGGSLFRESTGSDLRLASSLPEKVVYAPMGISSQPFPDNTGWVIPGLAGRPVILWGGGIWSWFDIPTLLKSFQKLSEWNHPAALYFLAGVNPSGLSSQDLPVLQARALASELGLLGKSVFFHDSSVGPGDLPKYLSACRAGVMSNPRRLESLASWRTRLLDLLWAGKPAIVAGSDPLSDRMARAGAAEIVPSGDHLGLAEAIRRVCDDAEQWSRACDRSKAWSASMEWSRNLSEAGSLWVDADHWSGSEKASWPTILRCLAGL